ncbi:MAG: hypothetical protein FJX78_09175 [Armatimonadetes bacterium]|nr:hypothetical protein [Armatimonadota bacterium]
MIDGLLAAATLIGATLLGGAAWFLHVVVGRDADATVRQFVSRWAWTAAAVTVAASIGDLAEAALRIGVGADPSFFWRYAMESRQGNATLARVALAGVLGLLSSHSRRGGSIVAIAAIVIMFASISVTSHAAGHPGPVAILLDVVHGVAAAVWLGAVVGVAYSPLWRRDEGTRRARLIAIFDSVSATGLAAVILLMTTGAYAALLRIWGPPALVRTVYGNLLLAKLALFALALGIAAFNRWRGLRALRAGAAGDALRRNVRLESVVLLAIVLVTGFLTATAPPEPARRVLRLITVEPAPAPWLVQARAVAGPDATIQISLHVTDAAGNGPPPATPIGVRVSMPGHDMDSGLLAATRVGPGRYQVRIRSDMAGRWTLLVVLPEGRARLELEAR